MLHRFTRCTCVLALLVAAGCAPSETATDETSAAANKPPAESATTSEPAANDSAATERGGGDSADIDLLEPAPEVASDPGADAAAEGPPTPEDFHQQLNEAVQTQDLSKAIEVVDAALAMYPNDRQMQRNRIVLGIHHAQTLESTDLAAAAEQYHSAAAVAQQLRSAPDAADSPSAAELDMVVQFAAFQQGRAYAYQKKIAESLASFREAGERVRQLDVADDELMAPLQDNAEFQEGIAAIRKEEARRAIAESESFEFDFELPDLDQASVKRSDFEGKVLIVDLWGTWCPPCRAEIPHFVQLKQAYPDDLEIVGISYEHDEGEAMIERVRAFATEHEINYPLVIGDQTTQEKIPDLRGFPTTIFLDRNGKVRLMVVGYHSYEMLDAFVAALLEASPA